jgi:superoxide reductase
MSQKFYINDDTGIILANINGAAAPAAAKELVAGTTDAAAEKHVPVCQTGDGKAVVTVGSVEHPMLPEHFIEWIAVKTDAGLYFKYLKAGDKPSATFDIGSETVEEVFAYCNLHKLWKA